MDKWKYMLHLIYDTDFILGGYLAQYLLEEDLIFLHEKIRQMTPFEEALFVDKWKCSGFIFCQQYVKPLRLGCEEAEGAQKKL